MTSPNTNTLTLANLTDTVKKGAAIRRRAALG